MDNRIDVLPGTSGRLIVGVAGWATGPAVFERVFARDLRVVVTPFNPDTVVRDVIDWVRDAGIKVDQVVGFSMGVSLATHLGAELHIKCPVIGMGGNNGFDHRLISSITRLLDRAPDAYLREFWRTAAGCKADVDWALSAFEDVGWSVDALKSGLNYLADHRWLSSELPVSLRLIHGELDAISPIDVIAQAAQALKIPLERVAKVGHILTGPNSVEWLSGEIR